MTRSAVLSAVLQSSCNEAASADSWWPTPAQAGRGRREHRSTRREPSTDRSDAGRGGPIGAAPRGQSELIRADRD